MAITNGYITLANFKAVKTISSTDATDDGVIERMIEQASRYIDIQTGRTFYARTETHYFDVPGGRELRMDDDLLTITTLTNGDDNTIADTEYNLVPKNTTPYYAIRLKQMSSKYWDSDSDGNTEDVISVAGTWGYSDGAPMDVQQACEDIVLRMYGRRYGKGNDGQVKVTAAGVVVTPNDVSSQTQRVINYYKRRL